MSALPIQPCAQCNEVLPKERAEDRPVPRARHGFYRYCSMHCKATAQRLSGRFTVGQMMALDGLAPGESPDLTPPRRPELRLLRGRKAR